MVFQRIRNNISSEFRVIKFKVFREENCQPIKDVSSAVKKYQKDFKYILCITETLGYDTQ